MLKIRLYAVLAVTFCAIVIGYHRYTSSFLRQWTYLPQPITIQSSEMVPNFSPGLSNSKCPLKGYVLVWRHAGQQGGGVKSLILLQHWVRDTSLPMMIVEPFIRDSVVGYFGNSLHELKFSDMFDFENFNRVSRSEGVVEMIPWETYVIKGEPFSAVLVRLKKNSAPPKVLWNARPGSNECWKNGDNYNITINTRNLCYVRVVDYPRGHNSSRMSSTKEFCNILFDGLELTTVNLVFDMWAQGVRPSVTPVSPNPSLHLSESSVKKRLVSSTHKLKESPRLLLDIENYQKKFLMGHSGPSYVAVMLRAEHIVRYLNHTKESANLQIFQSLLNETVNITSVAMAELGIENVFVTADVGLYGSNSWRKKDKARVGKQVKCTVEKLYKNRWTFEQWEKSFSQATKGVKDRGYIAAVQRGVASQASCLVLVGGGSFQEFALRRYVGQTALHNRCNYFVGFGKMKKLQTLKES